MSTTVELYKILDAMEKAERQLEAADRLADAVEAHDWTRLTRLAAAYREARDAD